jgi:4-amino-4-deoxy-L-arabinose transferase-like glycosyltransferase
MSLVTRKNRILSNGMIEGTPAETRKLFGMSKQQIAIAAGLGLIVSLGAFLRFYELGAYSIGNTYYAATVQSMLTSWHNFFFASFEPGGSVTVDKPPLGFWIQAVSAYFLGVNGFALVLPQALAGVLSIPLLYALVKRQFGAWVGLIAALALAITPVTVSTERNNTIDGLLLFVLLLATWAFLWAVRNGRFRHLFLGAFLVGLGFNIKMLQAFMPLPALYALYLLGAPHRWWKRIVHLGVATVVLLVVSLSWAIVVDLTPPQNRPYVGSSEDDTVMELIVGHNGLRRLGLDRLVSSDRATLAGRNAPSPPVTGQPGQSPTNPPPPPIGGRSLGQFPPNQPPLRLGAGSGSGNPLPPQFGPENPSGNPPAQQRGGPNQEVGEAGALRLFTEPLVTEASWLLTLALLGTPLISVVLGWSWPLSDEHLALVLWGGWLLPELAYFSFTSGLFHAYYLIMLGPPLAALVGATAWAIGQVWQRRPWLGWTLLALLAGITIAFQIVTLQNYPGYAWWIAAGSVALLVSGLGVLALTVWQARSWLAKAALGIVFLAMMVAPLTWSALTTLNTDPDVALPRAGPDIGKSSGSPNASDTLLSLAQEATLDYLLAHTEPDDYLVATLSSHDASLYILATSRPVLTFGGFNGGDDVVDVDQLAQMVADDELRFVLGGQELARRKPEIAMWLADSCTIVTIPGATRSELADNQPSPPDGSGRVNILYDCGNQ